MTELAHPTPRAVPEVLRRKKRRLGTGSHLLTLIHSKTEIELDVLKPFQPLRAAWMPKLPQRALRIAHALHESVAYLDSRNTAGTLFLRRTAVHWRLDSPSTLNTANTVDFARVDATCRANLASVLFPDARVIRAPNGATDEHEKNYRGRWIWAPRA